MAGKNGKPRSCIKYAEALAKRDDVYRAGGGQIYANIAECKAASEQFKTALATLATRTADKEAALTNVSDVNDYTPFTEADLAYESETETCEDNSSDSKGKASQKRKHSETQPAAKKSKGKATAAAVDEDTSDYDSEAADDNSSDESEDALPAHLPLWV